MALTRRLDIQGLRAFAVLAVIGFHARLPIPGGFVGVDVFFVISGFVITAMLMGQRADIGRLPLAAFYWKRFKRLTPALSLMLAVCLLAAIPLLSPWGQQQAAADTAIAAVLIFANLQIARTTGDYFGASAEQNLFLNTWSLSVEEQFYLIFPVVLIIVFALAGRSRGGRHVAIVTLAVMALGSFALAVLGASGYSLDRFFWLLGFFSPLTRVWEFAVGAILALLADRLKPNRPWVGSAVGVLGALMLMASLWVISDETPFPGIWTLLPVVGTLCVIAAGSLTPTNPTARLLSIKPATVVGDYSYSLYLWHWPAVVLATIVWGPSLLVGVLAVWASAIPAVMSYRLVENPIRGLYVASSFRRMGYPYKYGELQA